MTSGKGFALKDCPTRQPSDGEIDRDAAAALLKDGIQRLSQLQEQLYAHGTWSVLVVLQAMDAGGKDGTIKNVMSGINPQGVSVTSFKAPGPDELAHGFLWRIGRALPARGMIGIFNRSHYEEVLVPRVHPEILAKQHLPPELAGKTLWDERLRDINQFEAYLGRQGTRVVKLFLHISKEEQRKRLLARLDDPAKHWKLDPADLTARENWDGYQAAYNDAIAATADKAAPWYVIPADQKWFARMAALAAITTELSALDLKPMQPTPEQQAAVDGMRKRLG